MSDLSPAVMSGVMSSDDVDVSGCWITFEFAICLSSVEFCQKAVTCSFRKVISAVRLLSDSL